MKTISDNCGVPYMSEMYPNFSTVSETIDFYEKILDNLYKENQKLHERVKILEEECNWLDHQNRKFNQTTQGEH